MLDDGRVERPAPDPQAGAEGVMLARGHGHTQNSQGDFTIVFAGRRAGKTALVDAFLSATEARDIVQGRDESNGVRIVSATVGETRMVLLDAPSSLSTRDLVSLVEARMKRSTNQRLVGDLCIHLCVYVMDAFSLADTLQGDLASIGALATRVNMLPVLGRADLLTADALSRTKRVVRDALCDSGLGFGPFEDDQQSPPYALVGPDDGTDAEPLVRRYPWATLRLLDPAHCDFVLFRDSVLAQLQTLKDLTHTTLLPAWARDVGIVLEPLVSTAPASLASQEPSNVKPDDSSQAATERLGTDGPLEDDHESNLNLDEMRRKLTGSVGPGAVGPNDPALSPIPGTSQYNLATGLPGVPKLRQKKILVACNFCRTRKLKCDGGRPACGQCIKRANNCDYQPVLRRARKSDAELPPPGSISAPTTSAGLPSSSPSTSTLFLASSSEPALPTAVVAAQSASSEDNTTPVPMVEVAPPPAPAGLALASSSRLASVRAAGSRRTSSASSASFTSARASPPIPSTRTLPPIDEHPLSLSSPRSTLDRPFTHLASPRERDLDRPRPSHSRSSSQSSVSDRSGSGGEPAEIPKLPSLASLVGQREQHRVLSAPRNALDSRPRAFVDPRPTLPPIQIPLAASNPFGTGVGEQEVNYTRPHRSWDNGDEHRASDEAVVSAQQQDDERYERRGYLDGSYPPRTTAHAQLPPTHDHGPGGHRRTASLPGTSSLLPPAFATSGLHPTSGLPPHRPLSRHALASPRHQVASGLPPTSLISPHHASSSSRPSPPHRQHSLASSHTTLSPRDRVYQLPATRRVSSTSPLHLPRPLHLAGATPVPPSPPIPHLRAASAVSPDKVAASRERFVRMERGDEDERERMEVDAELSRSPLSSVGHFGSGPSTSASRGSPPSGHSGHSHQQQGQQYSAGDPRVPKNPRFGPKTVACTFCRQRKTKCDGAHPQCSNCAKRGQACEYMEDLRRRVTGPHATVDSDGWPLDMPRPANASGGPSGGPADSSSASGRSVSGPPFTYTAMEARVTGDGQWLKKLVPLSSPVMSQDEEEDGEPPRKKLKMDAPQASQSAHHAGVRAGGW